MKLYASLTSPYARKIRVMLAEKHLPFELIVDSPWDTHSAVPANNPLGKVPVLISDTDEVFFDSPVVAAYIETLAAAPVLVPPDSLAAVRVRLTESLADGLCDAAIAVRLESQRPPELQNSADIERQLGKVARALASLEARLSGKAWFNGDTLQLGDIAVGIALGYLDFRYAQMRWRDRHPALADFAARIHARQSFIDTLPPST